MGRKIQHSDVQATGVASMRDYLREINIRLRDLAYVQNFNNSDMWDDLRLAASSVNLAGASSPPTIDTTYGTLLFQGIGAPQAIAFQAQMPHAWKEGTEVTPHVHWAKTTAAAGTVNWRLYYRHLPINGVMDGSWATIDASTTVAGTPDTNTALKHLITSFGPIDMTGKEISDMLICIVERDPALDSYGANAMLFEVDIHYQVDAFGSRQEFIK